MYGNTILELSQKFSLFSFLKTYRENQERINAYIKGDTIEQYLVEDYDIVEGYHKHNQVSIWGISLGIGIFLFLLILSFVVFVWALIITVMYWDQIPLWSKIIAILGLVVVGAPGPIITIIVVYIGKSVGPDDNDSSGRKKKTNRRK
jgi:hypothetical protein